MECTGHRSIEEIRSYKRTSLEQQENISYILHGKKPRMDIVPVARSQFTESYLPSLPPPMAATTFPCSQVSTNNISAPRTSFSSDDHAGVLYISSCSNIKKIDSARIWGSKWILLHLVLSAHAHYILRGIRGVSASSLIPTKNNTY